LKKYSSGIDLIIPAYNAGGTLEDCLKSALALRMPQNLNFNIIVVDNNSRDNTAHVARSLGVKVLSCAKQGRSSARNFGLVHSYSEYVAFIDSDTLVNENWLEEVLKLFNHKSIGAAQAQIIPGPTDTFVDHFLHAYKEITTKGLYVEMEAEYALFPLIDTAAAVYSRLAIDMAGGFDENLTFQEDRDLAIRIVACGFSIRSTFETLAYKQSNRSPIAYLVRTVQDTVVLARFAVVNSFHYLGRHLRDRIATRPVKLPEESHWSIVLFGKLHHWLSLFIYLLAYPYYFLQKLPKVILHMPPSKLNLLLPQVEGPSLEKIFIFSPHLRFYLSKKKLIIYRTATLPQAIMDKEIIEWFNQYLDQAEKMDFKRETIKRLISDGILVPLK
jgi:glycosyltransferase involved in cell wall biosynthesis